MNGLIKRIDDSFFFVVDADGQQKLNRLLEDCRAEIERLEAELARKTAYIQEFENLTQKELLKQAKEYVPMTGLDWRLFCYNNKYDGSLQHLQQAETATIKRYNQQRGVK